MAQVVKNLSAMQETWIWSLGWEHPLEKGMETHSNILVWRIPWTEEPGKLQSIWSRRVRHNWAAERTTHSCLLTDSIDHYLMSTYTVLGILSVCLQVYNKGPLCSMGSAKETKRILVFKELLLLWERHDSALEGIPWRDSASAKTAHCSPTLHFLKGF